MIEDAGLRLVLGHPSLLAHHANVLDRVPQLPIDMAVSHAGPWPVPGGTADDDIYAIYTSGSTGKPKG